MPGAESNLLLAVGLAVVGGIVVLLIERLAKAEES